MENRVDTHKPRKGRRRDDLRYQLFAEAYLDISNRNTYLKAMQSALKAGYSESYAKHHSYKLVDQRGVQDWMRRIRDDRLKSSTVATPEEVLEALTTQIRVLPNQLFDPETRELIKLADMDDRQAQAIAGYKVTQRVIPGSGEEGQPEVETKYEFKLVDRQVALEKLGRWHGIWEKDNRQRAAPATPVALVAFPTEALSLEEWQRQALIILTEKDAKKAAGP
jgi:phage terminase small subunit